MKNLQWNEPVDCILLYSNEFGATGIQVIQSINFVNWGQTVSVDDMYLESTYSYVASHITPFLAHNEFSSDGKAELDVVRKIEDVLGSINVRTSTPDDALILMSAEFDAETVKKYGSYMTSLLSDMFNTYDRTHFAMQGKDALFSNNSIATEIFSNPVGSVATYPIFGQGPEIP